MKAKDFMLCSVVGILTLTACSNNEDLYDPQKAEQLLKAEYSNNFFAKYGDVSKDYSWDATSIYPQYASTRAEVNYKPTIGEYYQVEQGTLNWLKKTLVNGKDNRGLGNPFTMSVPGNSFTIVPLFQEGQMGWTLHMVVGKEDITIRSKTEGIQIKERQYSSWKNLRNGSTNDVYAIRSLQYTFDLQKLKGENMYFYLEITNGMQDLAETGKKQSSLDGMMLALKCDRPSNIDEKNDVIIIGCEDANQRRTDWDLNDVVFMIYGNPDVPKPIEIKDGYIVETKTKRYMIEDLGSTDDFDFNDIVVDVTQEWTKKWTTVNGILTNEEYVGEPIQTAVIRHLGGTIPFQLTIGDTTFDEMQGQLDVDLETKLTDIKGWNPDGNNISIKVKNSKGDGVTIGFPGQGEAPMIIAVDPDVEWMGERIPITKEWFDSLKK